MQLKLGGIQEIKNILFLFFMSLVYGCGDKVSENQIESFKKNKTETRASLIKEKEKNVK